MYLEAATAADGERNKKVFRVVRPGKRQRSESKDTAVNKTQTYGEPETLSKEEDPSGMLSDMVAEYLRVSEQPKASMRNKNVLDDGDSDDQGAFVYDVYYRSAATTTAADEAESVGLM